MEQDWTQATDEELRTAINLPRSAGEIVLAEKAGEWAQAGDIAKAMDCQQAALVLYDARMATRKAALAEYQRRNAASAQPPVATGGFLGTCPRTVEYSAACVCGTCKTQLVTTEESPEQKALRFYANPATWTVDAGRSRYIPRSDAERDSGQQARKALYGTPEHETEQVTCDSCGVPLPASTPPDRPDDPESPTTCAACKQDRYGTPEHEAILLAEEHESERWHVANVQDAYTQLGKRETTGLADTE